MTLSNEQIKNILFGAIDYILLCVKSEHNGRAFSFLAKLFAKQVERWNTYASTKKQRTLTREGCVVSVAESCENIKTLTNLHFAHFLRSNTNNLVDYGKNIAGKIAHRDGTTKEESVELYIDKLTASYTFCITLKLHQADAACQLFVLCYCENRILHKLIS